MHLERGEASAGSPGRRGFLEEVDLSGPGWGGCRVEGIPGERHSMRKAGRGRTCRSMGVAARGRAWEVRLGVE